MCQHAEIWCGIYASNPAFCNTWLQSIIQLLHLSVFCHFFKWEIPPPWSLQSSSSQLKPLVTSVLQILCWDEKPPLMTTYVEMSGDSSTLSWRPASGEPQQNCKDRTESHSGNAGTVKILKVCFISNSFNLGKNFKLVKCDSSWEIKVGVSFSFANDCTN